MRVGGLSLNIGLSLNSYRGSGINIPDAPEEYFTDDAQTDGYAVDDAQTTILVNSP